MMAVHSLNTAFVGVLVPLTSSGGSQNHQFLRIDFFGGPIVECEWNSLLRVAPVSRID